MALGAMQTKHWAIVGAMLVAIGTQLSGTSHGWADVLTPQFIGGVVIQVGATIAAIFVERPQPKP